MYQIAKKLRGADKILQTMGYHQPSTHEAQELRIDEEVDLDRVIKMAADLVILQCDLELLKGNARAIASEYSDLDVKIVDILQARSVQSQTYTDTFNEAIEIARRRSGGYAPEIAGPGIAGSAGLISRGAQDLSPAEIKYPPSMNRQHVGGGPILQRHHHLDLNPYPSGGQPHSSPPHAVSDSNKHLDVHGDSFIRRGSAPILSPASSGEMGEFRSRAYNVESCRGTTNQGMIRRMSKSSSEGSLLDKSTDNVVTSTPQPKLASLTEQDSTEAPHFGIGSPTQEETNSMLISYSENAPIPNPDDLPEPLFINEDALAHNIPNFAYEYHHRRHSSENSESRVGIFVNARSTELEESLPKVSMLSPIGNSCLDRAGSGIMQGRGHFGGIQPNPDNISRVVADGGVFEGQTPPHSPSHGARSQQASFHTSSPRSLQQGNQLKPSFSDDKKPRTAPFKKGDENLSQHSGSSLNDWCVSPSHAEGTGKGRPQVRNQPQNEERVRKAVPQAPNQVKKEEWMNDDVSQAGSLRRTGGNAGTTDDGHLNLDSNLESSHSESNLDFSDIDRRFNASQTWTCDYCTFLNTNHDRTCEVCGILSKKVSN